MSEIITPIIEIDDAVLLALSPKVHLVASETKDLENATFSLVAELPPNKEKNIVKLSGTNANLEEPYKARFRYVSNKGVSVIISISGLLYLPVRTADAENPTNVFGALRQRKKDEPSSKFTIPTTFLIHSVKDRLWEDTTKVKYPPFMYKKFVDRLNNDDDDDDYASLANNYAFMKTMQFDDILEKYSDRTCLKDIVITDVQFS